jgi:hypothetical protein
MSVYWVRDNYNIIYKLIFQFSSTLTCVDFDVEQEILMDSKPALVKVYDYYETSKYENVCSELYDIFKK